MPTTIEVARLAILANQQEITHLLVQNPVDHLAVTELQVKNSRLLDRIRTAQNIATAAPRTSRVDAVLSQFVPRAFAR